jgi:hypothetical protein
VTINNLLPGAYDTDRLKGTMKGAAEKTGQPIEAIMDARKKQFQHCVSGIPMSLVRPVHFCVLRKLVTSQVKTY